MQTKKNEMSTINYNQKDSKLLKGLSEDQIIKKFSNHALRQSGYTKDDTSLAMIGDSNKKYFSDDVKEIEFKTKAFESTGKRSLIGGIVGAILGVIAAIGTGFVIPNLGILFTSPFAAGLIGATAIIGGVIGALVGAGIREERVRLHKSGIGKGSIVMGIHPRNNKDAEHFQKK